MPVIECYTDSVPLQLGHIRLIPADFRHFHKFRLHNGTQEPQTVAERQRIEQQRGALVRYEHIVLHMRLPLQHPGYQHSLMASLQRPEICVLKYRVSSRCGRAYTECVKSYPGESELPGRTIPRIERSAVMILLGIEIAEHRSCRKHPSGMPRVRRAQYVGGFPLPGRDNPGIVHRLTVFKPGVAHRVHRGGRVQIAVKLVEHTPCLALYPRAVTVVCPFRVLWGKRQPPQIDERRDIGHIVDIRHYISPSFRGIPVIVAAARPSVVFGGDAERRAFSPRGQSVSL